ncbi:hypothetical protein GYMLUDRAFT_248431 [Collybiopsis luxurians FD-317 M1]|uniref:Uncharacterized protein n=1 Tax=Collybiopsis luxurians FD-317 M1 TaxID=944289 RepID=A0A0D0C0I0_9AGAR|nr:hypothetical protein GYMLUDRAFT_248431 [Collybiopsis luxurians FD-317 M1]
MCKGGYMYNGNSARESDNEGSMAACSEETFGNRLRGSSGGTGSNAPSELRLTFVDERLYTFKLMSYSRRCLGFRLLFASPPQLSLMILVLSDSSLILPLVVHALKKLWQHVFMDSSSGLYWPESLTSSVMSVE